MSAARDVQRHGQGKQLDMFRATPSWYALSLAEARLTVGPGWLEFLAPLWEDELLVVTACGDDDGELVLSIRARDDAYLEPGLRAEDLHALREDFVRQAARTCAACGAPGERVRLGRAVPARVLCRACQLLMIGRRLSFDDLADLHYHPLGKRRLLRAAAMLVEHGVPAPVAHRLAERVGLMPPPTEHFVVAALRWWPGVQALVEVGLQLGVLVSVEELALRRAARVVAWGRMRVTVAEAAGWVVEAIGEALVAELAREGERTNAVTVTPDCLRIPPEALRAIRRRSPGDPPL